MSKHAVDILPIDISAYRKGNTGLDYVHRIDSGVPGPAVLVNALTHGNELCGAYAVHYLFEQGISPKRGSLTLSFANVAAYESFDPDNPTTSRFVDEDFNRLWSDEVLTGERNSAELARARALRAVVVAADFLLDIHSMQSKSPPLMLCGTKRKGRDLAMRVGVPVHVVADAGHKAGARMRDYGAFADPDKPNAALLVECGQHWQADSVSVAIETTLRFLLAVECIDAETAEAHLDADPPAQCFIEVSGPVTIESDDFAFDTDYQGLEVIAEAGTIIGYDGGTPIRTPYDDCVLIMPSRRLQPGQTAVRFGRVVG